MECDLKGISYLAGLILLFAQALRRLLIKSRMSWQIYCDIIYIKMIFYFAEVRFADLFVMKKKILM